MDLYSFLQNFSTLQLVASGIAIIVVILYVQHKKISNYWPSKGVKGPPTQPIIGCLEFLTTPGISNELAKKYGKVFGINLFNNKSLVVADVELIKDILIRNFHKFSD